MEGKAEHPMYDRRAAYVTTDATNDSLMNINEDAYRYGGLRSVSSTKDLASPVHAPLNAHASTSMLHQRS